MANISLVLYLGVVCYIYTILKEFCELPGIRFGSKIIVDKPDKNLKVSRFSQPKQISSISYAWRNSYNIITRDSNVPLTRYYYEKFLNRVSKQLPEFVIVANDYSGRYEIKIKEIQYRCNEFVLIWSDQEMRDRFGNMRSISPGTMDEVGVKTVELVNSYLDTVKDFDSFMKHRESSRR